MYISIYKNVYISISISVYKCISINVYITIYTCGRRVPVMPSFIQQWLRRWIPNPGVLCSKPLGGSKVDSAFHSPEVDKMSTRNFWELNGKK